MSALLTAVRGAEGPHRPRESRAVRRDASGRRTYPQKRSASGLVTALGRSWRAVRNMGSTWGRTGRTRLPTIVTASVCHPPIVPPAVCPTPDDEHRECTTDSPTRLVALATRLAFLRCSDQAISACAPRQCASRRRSPTAAGAAPLVPFRTTLRARLWMLRGSLPASTIVAFWHPWPRPASAAPWRAALRTGCWPATSSGSRLGGLPALPRRGQANLHAEVDRGGER